MNIGILGAGTWGIALANMLSTQKHSVTVWSALQSEVEDYSRSRKHPNLPYLTIPEEIQFTKLIEEACINKDLVVFAVPSIYLRNTAHISSEFLKNHQVIVNVTKGLESFTNYTMTQVIDEELRIKGINGRLVTLSGPTHAEEIVLGMPSAIVAASVDIMAAEFVQAVFMNDYFRVYTNPDILGVELCGALKNIIALGTGISQGLGYGDNTKAALITRGIAEISRLGEAMGCELHTFMGLAGIGDLVVTATSTHSRNNKAGYLIGQGKTASEAIAEVGMVVEGINTLPAAMELQDKYEIEMPIIKMVNAIVNQGMKPFSAAEELMNRDKKRE